MMRSILHVFFSIFISLAGVSHCVDQRIALDTQPQPRFCTDSPNSIISDACTSYSALDELNTELRDILVDITRNTDFFSYYRLILFGKDCPFWNDDNGVCGNIACAVNTLDNEEQIPPIWRAKELGKLEGPMAIHPSKQIQKKRNLQRPLDGRLGDNVRESCVIEDDERNYCISEEENTGLREDYVSLVDNPERFTGYAGEGTKQIWDAIYRENCFSGTPLSFLETLNPQQRVAANELGRVFRDQGQQKNQKQNLFQISHSVGFEDGCLEKRVFYRIISGMHSSISAHICYEYLNQTTGEWSPNLQCYKDRLHGYTDRIGNLYFNFAILLQATRNLGPYLKEYTFCSHDTSQNLITNDKVQSLINTISSAPKFFDQSLMFVNGEGPSLKEDFRKRFRNVSSIMDCVGCDKCRLWGKLQIAGYGTALKVLFESENNSKDVPKLKRTEIVALFNTLARVSSSIDTVKYFSSIINDENQQKIKETPQISSDRAGKSQFMKEQFMKGSEFDENDLDEFRRTQYSLDSSLSANLSSELLIFWKVTKYVIRSWLQFPSKLWQILKFEIPRAWNGYIGLPVKPRKWIFKRPDIDEL
ncbi:Endoplasmic reticulum oxidoreductin-1 [Erysiphe necator]|nr:Endoplasmic reticulum oxidoreductin-1 [Erysiphe necator]